MGSGSGSGVGSGRGGAAELDFTSSSFSLPPKSFLSKRIFYPPTWEFFFCNISRLERASDASSIHWQGHAVDVTGPLRSQESHHRPKLLRLANAGQRHGQAHSSQYLGYRLAVFPGRDFG
jgi:hypothetical protein